ncbi:hypothetical protein HSBAA_45440 [Vreelandella sulfidaeris]|uniref:Uncharacterized protein n=1 Tax=Vreelandella sulfidaeris TaxID=115553 RepID=A0A455UG19_9GAMM|nr:hypothetical protein HSBAA_45440 [Halomonas sulfidaeris]
MPFLFSGVSFFPTPHLALRGNEITLPSLRLALLQMVLGAVNWSLMAALVYLLLPQDVFYPTILGILLVSSIAG